MAMAMRKQGQVESCRAWPHEHTIYYRYCSRTTYTTGPYVPRAPSAYRRMSPCVWYVDRGIIHGAYLNI